MANATATAYYALTGSGDIPTAAAALKGEANIDSATFVYGVVESPVGDRRVGEIVVVASHATAAVTAEGYITAAAAAVGGLTLKPLTGLDAPNDMRITCDAPTLLADDDTPTQEEGAATVTVTFSSTNDYGAGSTTKIEWHGISPVYGFSTFTDAGDGTATLEIDSQTGDAGVYECTFKITDAIGQVAYEVVTVTITEP